MAHRQQDLIDRILGEESEAEDHSLRKQALDRALEDRVPRTMTPWEWEQYYAEHGVPESHQRAQKSVPDSAASPWWKRLLRLK